jgi:hypothetical protein
MDKMYRERIIEVSEGILTPLEDVLRKNHKVKCYSTKYKCDVWSSLLSVEGSKNSSFHGLQSIIDKTQYMVDNFFKGDLIPLEEIKTTHQRVKCYSITFECDVMINISSVLSGYWYDCQSVIDKDKFYGRKLKEKGLILKDKITKRHTFVKCYSIKYKCDIKVSIHNILNNMEYDFRSIIDKTQYMVDNFFKGDLIPLEEITFSRQKVKCYSTKYKCDVIIPIGGYLTRVSYEHDFMSIINKTQYVIENYLRGDLIPLEKVTRRTQKLKCYSNTLKSNITVHLEGIFNGQWYLTGWFHEFVVKYPDMVAYLYFIKLTSTQESFYKIGITRRKNKERYKDYKRKGYNVEEIKWVVSTCKDVYITEQKILLEFRCATKPKVSFDGQTEIVKYDEKILNMMTEIKKIKESLL